MKKYAVLAALAASVIMTFPACTVMRDTYQKKADEADTLSKRYAALEKEHEGSKAELAATRQQKEKLAAELAYATTQWDKTLQDRDAARRKVAELEKENVRLARSKEEQVKKVSSTYDDLLEKMKTEIERGQITISELKGKLSVNMVDSVLFDSGKAEVKKGGEEILDKVVSILKDVEDKAIRIEGHTDNVLISPSLAKRYPTNWELSAARALNVTRYLEKEGIDPAILSAAAFGEHQPVADNNTPEGRTKNRRIAITLLPKE